MDRRNWVFSLIRLEGGWSLRVKFWSKVRSPKVTHHPSNIYIKDTTEGLWSSSPPCLQALCHWSNIFHFVANCNGLHGVQCFICVKQQSWKCPFDFWKIYCGQILTLSDHPPFAIVCYILSLQPFTSHEISHRKSISFVSWNIIAWEQWI